jgi:protein SCO1
MNMRSVLAAAAAAWLALSAAAAAGPNSTSGASLYNLESKWTTQDGASVALSSFAGKPVILAMGYTTCKDICPAVVANMMWIGKHLPPDAAGGVRFAFFSFDSEADTPERLRLYADGHGLDLASWTLLTGDDDAVRELAAALDVPFRPNDQNGFDHAAVISLLDAKGEIVFQQRGAQASSDELLAKLKSLIAVRN